MQRNFHVMLAGNGAAMSTLLTIGDELRKRGAVCSAYCNDDFTLAYDRIDAHDFMLLCLNRDSRQPSTPCHMIEEDLMLAIGRKAPTLPCGVICDEDGYISAPYITKHSNYFRLVFAWQPIPGIFADYKSDAPDPCIIATHVLAFLNNAPARSRAV